MGDVIILEYSGGGAELAAPLPESVRGVCVFAAEAYRSGRERTARDIFLQVLEKNVPPRLRRRLKRYTVEELAHLASELLNGASRLKVDAAALAAAEKRLLGKGIAK